MMRQALPIAFLIISGCSSSEEISDLSCPEVADEAIRISKGEIVAINNRAETSRNDERLICHGLGFGSDGQELPLRFQAIKADDGGILIKYDIEEFRAALEAREERRIKAEAKQEYQDLMADAKQQVDQVIPDP